MRNFPILLFFASCSICITSCSSPDNEKKPQTATLAERQIIDLTYAFDSATVFWPTAEGFKLHIDFAGETERGFYYEANSFSLAEHGGTHLDAPIHFARGRQASDEIPLTNLIGPGVVIDVAKKAINDRDYLISVEDIQSWEKEHGRLPDGIIVLFRTGYGKFWPDRKQYMGTDKRGAEGVAELHFPGIHPDAALWLVQNRSIKAVGIDTPSLDRGQSTHFESHQIFFEKNIPGFENVAHLDELPDRGFDIIALPMKIRDGRGGPLRIIALMDPEVR